MSRCQMGLDGKGRMRLKLVLPLPPTDNQIYFNLPRGGRGLTAKAKAYHNEVKSAVAEAAACCPLSFPRNVPYTQIIKVYLAATENKGYKQGKTPNRYKKVDSTNRVKLVMDAVSQALGVDDCHVFRSVVTKFEDQERPRLVVIWREQHARTGPDQA